jgi:hypothetical protein
MQSQSTSQFKHGGLERNSINILRLISELEGAYQLTKYMAFDDDNEILDSMKKRYYTLYFKLNKQERSGAHLPDNKSS